MKVTILNFRVFLFSLVIFFMSINNFKPIIRGEIFTEASTFFIFIFFIFEISILLDRPLIVNSKSFTKYLQALFIITVSIIISFLHNLNDILFHNYKGQLGIVRFGWQFIIFVLTFLIQVFFIYNFFNKFSVNNIKLFLLKVINYNILFLSFFGLFEYLSNYLSIKLFFLVEWINFFPFFNIEMNSGFGRISIFSSEPSFLAGTLIFFVPFLLAQFIEKLSFSNFSLLFLCLLLLFLSDSRIGILVSITQIFFFTVYFFSYKNISLKFKFDFFKLLVTLFSVLCLFVFLNPKANKFIVKKIERFQLTTDADINGSNSTRFYSGKAGLNIGFDNFLFGVGNGQAGYYICNYIPVKIKKNNYEVGHCNCSTKNKLFPPTYSLPVRIFADLGIVGLLSFAYMFYKLFSFVFIANKISRLNSPNPFVYAVLISFLSLLINCLQIDSFRFVSFSICISLVLIVFDKRYESIKY